jgi:hypothetical protein
MDSKMNAGTSHVIFAEDIIYPRGLRMNASMSHVIFAEDIIYPRSTGGNTGGW